MTNRELLGRSNALQEAAERVQTTRMRYAIQKNLRRIEGRLEPYHNTLQHLADVHEVSMDGDLSDAPEQFHEELQTLLDEDAGDVEVHTISLDVLDREDEKGTDLPMPIISGLDWMITNGDA